eukprot:scaffold209738_cov20-Tisochrysis_lutea.AAC.2
MSRTATAFGLSVMDDKSAPQKHEAGDVEADVPPPWSKPPLNQVGSELLNVTGFPTRRSSGWGGQIPPSVVKASAQFDRIGVAH